MIDLARKVLYRSGRAMYKRLLAVSVPAIAASLRALDGLTGDRTAITVAHRLTTVRNRDQVLRMKYGRIVDRGTFDGLRNVSLRASLA